MKPKISVIIPLYNVANYVHRAAQSIASQNFSGLEVIAVDDGSTDNSLDILLEGLAGVNVTAIKQQNAGLSAARNAGIMAATGEYLLFLDSDDFLLPDAFVNILNALKESQPDALFGRYSRWSTAGGFISGPAYSWNPPVAPQKRTEYILTQLPEPAWNAWRYICKRKTILERELFFKPGILCEDVPWSVALLENIDTLDFLQTPFYAYYQGREGSIMNSTNPKRIIDLNNIIRELLVKYKGRPVLYKKFVWQSFFYINEYCQFNDEAKEYLWQSYCTVLPMYKKSHSILHKVTGYCTNKLLFNQFSNFMYFIKIGRRKVKYGQSDQNLATATKRKVAYK